MNAKIIIDRQVWNDFVGASICCNVTQSYEWGELAHYMGCSGALRIGVVDDTGQICAAMLVLVMRAPILNRPYFYAPRGPVVDDPDGPALSILLNFVKAEARKHQAFMLKIEPSVSDGDSRWLLALQKHGFRPNPYATHVRHEWVLDIRPSEQMLQAGMKDKWRYNIRLASRKGVTVRRGEGQADLDAFYRIYETTSARDQFSIHDKAHYEDILRMFSEENRGMLLLAEYDGQAIAGTITLSLGRWSWYMFGASANDHRERMPIICCNGLPSSGLDRRAVGTITSVAFPIFWRRARNCGGCMSSSVALVAIPYASLRRMIWSINLCSMRLTGAC